MTLFATSKAIDRLTDRLSAVEDLAADLKRDRKSLDLEFTELYDKVRHQMSRMAKRDALSRKENGEDLEVQTPDDEYSHLDPVSRSIMMRRARGAFAK